MTSTDMHGESRIRNAFVIAGGAEGFCIGHSCPPTAPQVCLAQNRARI